MPNVDCATCGEEHHKKPSQINESGNHFCDPDCFKKWKRSINPNIAVWEDSDGYMVANPGHRGERAPFRLHRLQAVSIFGFEAVEGMHVHHDNQMALDNRECNLVLLTPAEHALAHDNLGTKDNDDKPPWRDEYVLRELYLNQNMSTREVGNVLGCSQATASEWLRRLKIPTRDSHGRPTPHD